MSIIGFLWASKSFLLGVKQEVERISWPSRREFLGNFVVVLIFIAIFSVALWFMDSAIKFFILKLYS